MKHLPPEVIANKFRDRGWEVNASGRDACPDCISRRRGIAKGTKLGPRKKYQERIIPLRRKAELSAVSLKNLLSGCGFLAVEVVELHNTKTFRRFKCTLRSMPEIHLGRLIHAETEIISTFQVSRENSFIKPDILTEAKANKVNIELITYWYLTLDEGAQRAVQAAE